MKIFFTAFTAIGGGSKVSELYTEMSRSLIERIGGQDYGPGLTDWYLMFVLVPDDFGGEKLERRQYDPEAKSVDLRLRVDPRNFQQAKGNQRAGVLYDAVRRSVEVMRELQVPDVDLDRLARDVADVAAEQGWSR